MLANSGLNLSHDASPLQAVGQHGLRGATDKMAKMLASAEVAGEEAAESAVMKTQSTMSAHKAALPSMHSERALPWITTTILKPVETLNTLILGNATVTKDGKIVSKETQTVAKFTASAQASAKQAHQHLEAAKAALEKTTHNAGEIHSAGKKIEKTGNTIGYLYSTPKPKSPEMMTPLPAPKSGTRQFSVLSVLVLCLSGIQ